MLIVLIAHGVQDRIVPLSNSRRLAASNSAVTLVELEGCGHCPQEELPDELARVIDDFVRSNGR